MKSPLIALAASHGYTLQFHKPENRLFRFIREDGEVRIDIWDSTFTIGIIFKGKPPVFLKERKRDEIEEIFMSPEFSVRDLRPQDTKQSSFF